MTAYPPAPNPLETVPRYTTVAAVKRAMGIDSDSWDTEVSEAIVATELLIDYHLGTSYPQDADPNTGTDDALVPAPIEGIPDSIRQAATIGSMKVMTLTQAPFGTAGSDEFVGEIDFGNATQRAFDAVRPLLLGLRREWGLA